MNPEFLRQLTLEFSLARLISMPALLGLIFFLAYLSGDQVFGPETASSAVFLYIIITLFWGTRQTSESIFDEIRNNTWDVQKTSALSPWSLTWGKLLGSSSYTWYGGLFCLIMLNIAPPNPEHRLVTNLLFLSSGLLSQSLGLLNAILSLPSKKINNTFSYIFAAIILMFIMPYLLGLDDEYDQYIYWFGQQYSKVYFLTASLCLFCFWSIIGSYRLLAEELQVRTLPWVWVIFVIFTSIYLSGFFTDKQDKIEHYPSVFIIIWYGVCLSLTYVWLLLADHNPMQLRKLWVDSIHGRWLRVGREMPCWLVNMILVFPLALLLSFIPTPEKVEVIHFYPMVAFFMLIRDIALFLYFSYSPNPKQATAMTFLCLGCLYVLFPVLLHQTPLKTMAQFILPLLSADNITAWGIALTQTVLSVYLLWQRWQARFLSVNDSI